MRTGLKPFFAVAGAIALLVGGGGSASADSLFINFETSQSYHTGSIQGQQGWGGGEPATPISLAIDQGIVSNTYGYPSFDGQSFRMSNAYTDGAFGDWPFSPSLANEAGETMALNHDALVTYSGGTRQNHFEVQWDFASTVPNAEQVGLQISASPDRGDGARMSFIRMRDLPAGLSVEFVDYQDVPPYGSLSNPDAGCDTNDGFVLTTVASGLARDEPHTVRLSMDFVDGPHNDVVKVYVDGTLRHTGTSWEDYFRWCSAANGGSGGGIPNDSNADQSRTVDSMIFQARTSGGTAPGTLGKGFLFDNLGYSSSISEQCDNRHADGDGDVESGSGGRAHMHFHKDGCGKNDGDNVQQDDQQGHHFQSTSVDSAQFSTGPSGRSVTMIGTGLDNGLPVGFTLIGIDLDGLVPASYSLVLTDGYSFVGSLASGTVSI